MIETKFKNSEVGTIPEDWEAKALGEVFEFKNGLNASKDCFGHGTPIVNYRDVYDNYSLKREQIKGLVSLSQADIKRYQVKKGDVFFTRTSETPEEVGLTSVLLDDIENCVFSGFVLRARPYKNINIDYRYFAFCFLTKSVRNEIIQGCSCTTRALTNGRLLSGVHVILPPTSTEQSRIATALSDVDDLIATLKKLIEKKRNIKQGVMQELLSGKRRLPGFSDKWVEKKVGIIGNTYNGLSGKTKEDFGVGESQYITFLNVLNNPVIDTSIFEQVNILPNERQNKAIQGDIFFNTSSETPEEVGICSYLDNEIDNLYLNSFCFGFRITDSEVDGHFLAYFWRSRRGREIMTMLAQGSTRFNLSKSLFKESSILIPPTKKEQIAIVNVISDMDSEISMLELRLTKYQSLKQGMMQQLLTGKIRLI